MAGMRCARNTRRSVVWQPCIVHSYELRLGTCSPATSAKPVRYCESSDRDPGEIVGGRAGRVLDDLSIKSETTSSDVVPKSIMTAEGTASRHAPTFSSRDLRTTLFSNLLFPQYITSALSLTICYEFSLVNYRIHESHLPDMIFKFIFTCIA